MRSPPSGWTWSSGGAAGAAGPLLTAANRLAAEVARTVRQCELTGAADHDGKASMDGVAAGSPPAVAG